MIFRASWNLLPRIRAARAFACLAVSSDHKTGMGLSDFQPGRRIVDWPADVGELADALGIEQFCVMGLSCGGPFAAATAHALPQRVTRLALVSSVGRFDIPGGTKGMGPGLMYFRLARYAPWLSRRMVRMMGDGMKSNPQEMTRRVIAGPPHPRPRRPILPRRGAYLRAGQSYC